MKKDRVQIGEKYGKQKKGIIKISVNTTSASANVAI